MANLHFAAGIIGTPIYYDPNTSCKSKGGLKNYSGPSNIYYIYPNKEIRYEAVFLDGVCVGATLTGQDVSTIKLGFGQNGVSKYDYTFPTPRLGDNVKIDGASSQTDCGTYSPTGVFHLWHGSTEYYVDIALSLTEDKRVHFVVTSDYPQMVDKTISWDGLTKAELLAGGQTNYVCADRWTYDIEDAEAGHYTFAPLSVGKKSDSTSSSNAKFASMASRNKSSNFNSNDYVTGFTGYLVFKDNNFVTGTISLKNGANVGSLKLNNTAYGVTGGTYVVAPSTWEFHEMASGTYTNGNFLETTSTGAFDFGYNKEASLWFTINTNPLPVPSGYGAISNEKYGGYDDKNHIVMNMKDANGTEYFFTLWKWQDWAQMSTSNRVDYAEKFRFEIDVEGSTPGPAEITDPVAALKAKLHYLISTPNAVDTEPTLLQLQVACSKLINNDTYVEVQRRYLDG